MVINDVTRITDEIRSQLSSVFTSQYNEVQNNISEYVVHKDLVASENLENPHYYKDQNISGTFEYTNHYNPGHLNLIRTATNTPVMGVFNFNTKNTVKIFRLLKIEKFRPQLSGIRIYANTELPMHMDLNRGGVGRENPIYSIMLTGKESMVFFTNKKDSSKLAVIPALSEFIMYPTMIQHGALTGNEDMDVLQIQLENIF